MRPSDTSLQAAGYLAWSLHARDGHTLERALELATKIEVDEKRWATLYGPERRAAAARIREKYLERARLELRRQERKAADREYLKNRKNPRVQPPPALQTRPRPFPYYTRAARPGGR